MAVKVTDIFVPFKPCVFNGSGSYFYQKELPVSLSIVKADVKMTLVCIIGSGFRTDGASTPKLLQWFLPSWKKDKGEADVTSADIYNLASTIHDGFYIHKGFGLFTREECDDILRCIWRISGVSRFKAGVADKAIELFAGCKHHWGNDSYGVGKYFSIDY